MSASISLLFGVHAHQPAGNFAEVIEAAHARCYRPFLQVLYAVPDFRFAIHCSGPLLDALVERFPEDIRLLEEMVARGQVELFGGGDTEPVLAAIPDRDRRGQLGSLAQKLAARFGEPPHGAWLTERVWEATVVPALADGGIRYVTVDDYHFLCAGREAAELDGYFETEEDGRTLALFPIAEGLRYKIPFAPAAAAVAHIESLARPGAAAIYFDDIEKFGIWPETHEWVYERGWLAEFLRRVLASKHIVTRTYGDFHAAHRPRGIVYLPATGYIEMNEWTLPASAAQRYVDLVHREKDGGRYERTKPFVRGGIWRNFLSRYPEANWMHKRMLGLSARLAALPGSPDPALARLLYLAQANDAYWHGLFGGIYLPHLRRGVYRSLVALEAALDRVAPRPACTRSDLDHDGVDEIFLHTDTLQAIVRDDGRASICELDAYALAQNLGDTMRRHAEHYHRAIVDRESKVAPQAGIASAHDRVSFRHEIGPAEVVPDERARSLFVDAWVAPDGGRTPIDGYALEYEETHSPAVRFRAASGTAAIEKHVTVGAERLDVLYRVAAGAGGRLEVELDLAMPSCDGPGGRFRHAGASRGGFGDSLALEETTGLTLDDTFLGAAVTLGWNRLGRVLATAYRTVSQSEQGFERIMQSVTVALSWELGAGEHELNVTLAIVPHAATR
jgi:4-alpha-glucanotransferase